jgi:hypothetical protein
MESLPEQTYGDEHGCTTHIVEYEEYEILHSVVL